MKKRYLALLLLGLLLSGCGGTQTDIPAETTADTAAEVVETEISYDPMIEAVDCGGRDYTILSRLCDGTNYCYPYREFLAEESTGEAINDAVFARNTFLEEKYNFVLNAPEDAANDVEGTAKKAIMAGDAMYDMLNIRYSSAYNLSIAGLLQNINDMPYVDFTKPYWRESIMKNASVAGKNYFATGDMNLSSLNGVGVVFFNKEMAEDMNVTGLYDTVRAGDWTFDTFTEYCKGVSNDLNGDQIYNEEDVFGLTTNGFAWQPFFAGTDSTIISKDENDIPVFNWDTEHNIDIISRIISFVNDRESVILMNQYPNLESIGWGQASINMFSENRALFWIEIIYGIHQLREMDKDFGILPMPKYDENQDNYASYIHCGWPCTMAIPVTSTDTDLTGRLLEDMAYQSSTTIRPAFYDVTLKGKVARDNESGEMLDIIYSNINLDIAVLLQERLPVDTNMRNFLIKNTTDFVSTITSLKTQCETKLQSDVETILALEH